MKKPRVVFDGRVVGSTVCHGIARCVFETLTAMAKLPREFEVVVLVSKDSCLTHIPNLGHFVVVNHPWLSVIKGQWEMWKILKFLQPDLFHTPSFVVPWQPPCPLMVTLHDMNHLALPQHYGKAQSYYYKGPLARVLRRTQAVVTVSEFSRKEILRFYPWLEPARIHVLPNSVSAQFTPQQPQTIARLRARLELPPDFILAAGTRKPHKNLAQLLRVYKTLPNPLPLVILSAPLDGTPPAGVRYLSPVSDADLATLYGAAHMFVFPSLYEGFGLPALEALACGTPVVVADNTSLPEVCGPYAGYFNPEDDSTLAAALTAPRIPPPEFATVTHWTWEDHARGLVSLYEAQLTQRS